MPVEAGILTTRFEEGTTGSVAANAEASTANAEASTTDAEASTANDGAVTGNSDAATVEWLPSDLVSNGDDDRDPETVTRRLEIAERAYGKGWRSYHDTMRPDCQHFELRRAGRGLVPHCAAKGRLPTARECAGSCPSFAPEPPQWRTKGWPIEGGPGAGIRSLLDRRRERARSRVETPDGW